MPHLRKSETGQKVYHEKQLGNVMSKLDIDEKISAISSQDEQGMFILGTRTDSDWFCKKY